ncbi:uncharacterized protein LOC113386596 [Ctenocephalides felis]|uniref:uncharacterized protein LOC113386596 n=1 Tax=Ctenocephalides felis TaxID=7515 RepID=UPI000E6E10BE|nr:uncharacterized protein LOC113386596 [Ctenocephalides felis]
MYTFLICFLSFVIFSSCGRNEGSLLQQSYRPQKKSAFHKDNKCPAINEVFTECGLECDPKCYQIFNVGGIPKCVPETCTPGCICRRGTARRSDGTCVPYNVCQHGKHEDVIPHVPFNKLPPPKLRPSYKPGVPHLPTGDFNEEAYAGIHKEPYEDGAYAGIHIEPNEDEPSGAQLSPKVFTVADFPDYYKDKFLEYMSRQ